MEDPSATIRQATRKPTVAPVVLSESDEPAIRTEALHFATGGPNEFWDLTDLVREVVARANVRHGQVTVYTPHTTTSIVINESETGFLNDFRKFIGRTVPTDVYYEHDDHSVRTENVRQLLVGQPSVTVPVVDGEVLLGQWQRVMFIELDQARERRAFVHAQGI